MNDDIFVRIFGGLGEEFISEANEDINFWLKSLEGEVVRAGGSRRSPWRAVIASVACTAAVLFGVLVLLLNVGRIDTISSSEKLSSVRVAFDVQFWESPKQYANFTASRDTVSIRSVLYIHSAALVEFHRDGYDGPVDASLIISRQNYPRPNILSAVETTSLDVQKGETYYITVSTYDGWAETIGDITIWY